MVRATHVWNMFDFAADGRDEGGKNGENQKGLVTFDRKIKKDAFYLYKAYWSIVSPLYTPAAAAMHRAPRGCDRGGSTSNLPEVSLYKDGHLVETKKATKCFGNVPITGKASIEPRGVSIPA